MTVPITFNGSSLVVSGDVSGLNAALLNYTLFLALREGASAWAGTSVDNTFVVTLHDVLTGATLHFNVTTFPNVPPVDPVVETLARQVFQGRQLADSASPSGPDTALTVVFGFLVVPEAVLSDTGNGVAVVANMSARASALQASLVASLQSTTGQAALSDALATAALSITAAIGNVSTPGSATTIVGDATGVTASVPPPRYVASVASDSSSGHIGGGAIAGIVIAAITVAIVAGIYYMRVRARRGVARDNVGELAIVGAAGGDATGSAATTVGL